MIVVVRVDWVVQLRVWYDGFARIQATSPRRGHWTREGTAGESRGERGEEDRRARGLTRAEGEEVQPSEKGRFTYRGTAYD